MKTLKQVKNQLLDEILQTGLIEIRCRFHPQAPHRCCYVPNEEFSNVTLTVSCDQCERVLVECPVPRLS